MRTNTTVRERLNVALLLPERWIAYCADFFRAKLANAYDTELEHELDFILNTTMRVFDQVVQVPVLLSMLAVVLGAQDTESGELKLPHDLSELYRMAVGAVIEKRVRDVDHTKNAIRTCLRKIAYVNHLDQRAAR